MKREDINVFIDCLKSAISYDISTLFVYKKESDDEDAPLVLQYNKIEDIIKKGINKTDSKTELFLTILKNVVNSLNVSHIDVLYLDNLFNTNKIKNTELFCEISKQVLQSYTPNEEDLKIFLNFLDITIEQD